MDVELQYFDGCPNWRTTNERLATALDIVARRDVCVHVHQVTTIQQAEAVQFAGSPTVLIDGRDPFAEPSHKVGMTCRLYRTPDGVAGSPTVEQLVAVLR